MLGCAFTLIKESNTESKLEYLKKLYLYVGMIPPLFDPLVLHLILMILNANILSNFSEIQKEGVSKEEKQYKSFAKRNDLGNEAKEGIKVGGASETNEAEENANEDKISENSQDRSGKALQKRTKERLLLSDLAKLALDILSENTSNNGTNAETSTSQKDEGSNSSVENASSKQQDSCSDEAAIHLLYLKSHVLLGLAHLAFVALLNSEACKEKRIRHSDNKTDGTSTKRKNIWNIKVYQPLLAEASCLSLLREKDGESASNAPSEAALNQVSNSPLLLSPQSSVASSPSPPLPPSSSLSATSTEAAGTAAPSAPDRSPSISSFSFSSSPLRSRSSSNTRHHSKLTRKEGVAPAKNVVISLLCSIFCHPKLNSPQTSFWHQLIDLLHESTNFSQNTAAQKSRGRSPFAAGGVNAMGSIHPLYAFLVPHLNSETQMASCDDLPTFTITKASIGVSLTSTSPMDQSEITSSSSSSSSQSSLSDSEYPFSFEATDASSKTILTESAALLIATIMTYASCADRKESKTEQTEQLYNSIAGALLFTKEERYEKNLSARQLRISTENKMNNRNDSETKDKAEIKIGDAISPAQTESESAGEGKSNKETKDEVKIEESHEDAALEDDDGLLHQPKPSESTQTSEPQSSAAVKQESASSAKKSRQVEKKRDIAEAFWTPLFRHSYLITPTALFLLRLPCLVIQQPAIIQPNQCHSLRLLSSASSAMDWATASKSQASLSFWKTA
ncbi:uncharacterized protein MONOS_2900 [Monocercomonoides exilis]|uniref:uncharacterized protein n=1 Tax=Monocercomonoides exilis TaxID=2049356 RepID=UPI003559B091|nr:hypothetical protein MONOS_2900 [Monocercomonoides exilis]